MMGWDDGGWNAGWWLVMSLMMVAFWGGLIALGVWAVRSLTAPSERPTLGFQPSAATRHADEVLAERFARGEIDEDEYARRKAVLHQAIPAD